MSHLDGLEGLDGAFDAFDWVTRDSADRADTDGAIQEDISMDGVFHKDSQNGIDPDNAEQRPNSQEQAQVEAQHVQSDSLAADDDDPKERAVPDNTGKEPIIQEESEFGAGNSQTESVAADAIPMEDAVPETAWQEASDHDSMNAASEILGDLTIDGISPSRTTQSEEDEELVADSQRDGSQDDADSGTDQFPAHATQLEVKLPTLPESLLEEYSIVLSEVVDHIRGEVEAADSYLVEFTDGRVETLSIVQESRCTSAAHRYHAATHNLWHSIS